MKYVIGHWAMFYCIIVDKLNDSKRAGDWREKKTDWKRL